MTPPTDEQVEAVARAICEAREISPNTLYQHNFEGDWPEDERREYVDPFSGEPRVQLFHRAWRRHDKAARAAIAAATKEALKPFAWFQWNDGWNLWEQVADEYAGTCDDMVAAYRTPPSSPAGEVERLREALTPSGATKAAYIGEIKFTVTDYDEFGDERHITRTLEWTTTKEVMAMIAARAALNPENSNG